MPKRFFSRFKFPIWSALGIVSLVIAIPVAPVIPAHSAGLPDTLPDQRDAFDHLIDANEAQIIVLLERELVEAELAHRIATALANHAGNESAPGAERNPDYLVLEAALAEQIGPEASNLHLGRSRNDLGAAMNRMALRQDVLRVAVALHGVRTTVHELADQHVATVMPGFTHAVQAQPTTLAHFLLAFDGALARDAERLQQAYARLNRSPLGAAAITTSGFALDRQRLAYLLAFDGLVENAYDAIVVSTADSKVETAATLSLSAISVGRLAQDLLFQYDDPAPAIVLAESAAGRSSIMPQKRNPSMIEMLRVLASEVVADAHKATVYVHNTPLHEVRDSRKYLFNVVHDVCLDAEAMYEQLGLVLTSLEFRIDALRERVDNDYSTMTELADSLYREAGVPFRDGYRFASALTSYGREHGLSPADIRHEQAASVYADVLEGRRLPLDESQFEATVDAAAVVANRKGRGGPQPAEVRRMLDEATAGNTSFRRWVDDQRQLIEDRHAELDRLFSGLLEQ